MGWFSRRFRRVPFVPQMEIAECGAASLGMVLAYYGCEVPLAELRHTCAVSRDGASAFDIVVAAREYGLEVSAIKVELDALPELELPAIVHWDLNHFLVLERVTRSGVDVVDPAVGRRHFSLDEVGRSFTGVVLEMSPGEDFEERKRPGRSTEAYKGLLRRLAWPITVMILSAFLLEVFALLFPAATALVVDFVVRPRQESWRAGSPFSRSPSQAPSRCAPRSRSRETGSSAASRRGSTSSSRRRS
jgi:ABC-type bacteriocin/lantibiotic exporter with double-glycine peptidase domain